MSLLSVTCYASVECGEWCIQALLRVSDIERLVKKVPNAFCYEETGEFWNLVRSLLAIETFSGYNDGFWPLPDARDIEALEAAHKVHVHMIDRRGDRLVEYTHPIPRSVDDMQVIHISVESDDIPEDTMVGIMEDEEMWQTKQTNKIEREKMQELNQSVA